MQVMSEEVLEENLLHMPEESITVEYLPDIWLMKLRKLILWLIKRRIQVFKNCFISKDINKAITSYKTMKFLMAPVIWHLIYLLFGDIFDSKDRIYWDLIFYSGLAVYFTAIMDISVKDLWYEWKKGKGFWFPVLYTVMSIIAAFEIGSMILSLFPNVNDGMGVFKVVNVQTLFAFAFTTILLLPIAEEAFYRKGIIKFDNNISLFITSVIGTLLYASEHSLKPLGFLIACIWSLPFTMSYIKTRNIYITMTSHFICNLAFNGTIVIVTAMKLFG
ncbi:MAG: type II CAAX endopeptidase family protein [Clostridiaceae bacterium]